MKGDLTTMPSLLEFQFHRLSRLKLSRLTSADQRAVPSNPLV